MISIDTRKKYQMNWLSHNNKETRKTTITKDRITELQWLVRQRKAKNKTRFFIYT